MTASKYVVAGKGGDWDAIVPRSELRRTHESVGGRTAFVDDIEASVRDIVVLELILALGKRPDENGVVLRRHERDRVQSELRWHGGKNQEGVRFSAHSMRGSSTLNVPNCLKLPSGMIVRCAYDIDSTSIHDGNSANSAQNAFTLGRRTMCMYELNMQYGKVKINCIDVPQQRKHREKCMMQWGIWCVE